MKLLFRLSSYIFHPLWMPFLASLFYFAMTPRYFPFAVIETKLMGIAIMTLFIPIVFFFLLRTLQQASSYFLKDVGERRWPLLFYVILNAIVLKYILNRFDYPELYFYFLGVLIAASIALTLVFFKIKASLHMMGLAGIIVFFFGLGWHFQLHLVYTTSFLILITGLTASARLDSKAHTHLELILGLLIGLLPQLWVLQFIYRM